jgi:hypothetical protein
MNVHPSGGLNPPGPTTSEPFAPEARYELKIDTDGDAVANISYEVRFASVEGGGQTATLRRVEGADGKVIVEGAPVSTGHEAHVAQAGDHRFFAGWRSDPFFFDVLGTLNLQHRAGSAQLSFWAERGGDLVSHADSSRRRGWLDAGGSRGAAQSNSLSCGAQNDAYLAGEPADDARFGPVFAHALEHTGGYTAEEAKQVAGKLLPDILRYDPKRAASFPDNGRALIDDVSDIFLAILTNGKVTGDNVGPHKDFLDEFPYPGPAAHVAVNARRRQFSDGLSTPSIIQTWTGPLADSSFRPSWSDSAVKSDGASVSEGVGKPSGPASGVHFSSKS